MFTCACIFDIQFIIVELVFICFMVLLHILVDAVGPRDPAEDPWGLGPGPAPLFFLPRLCPLARTPFF